MSEPRRRGPRGDLSHARVVAAADAVLTRAGVDGLSLRAVALELGVAPNALYTYVHDLPEVRNAVADGFLGRLDLSLLADGEPRAALTAFLSQALATFAAGPAHVRLLADGPVSGPNALALNEALLGFFDDAGLSEEEAWEATLFATEWVHGVAVLTSSQEGSPSFRRGLAGLDAHPRTARMLGSGFPGGSVALAVRALLPGGSAA